jgi:phosphatidylglycerophosphate synthase
MKFISEVISVIRDIVRNIIFQLAKRLNKLTSGNITPNSVTYTSLLAHIPIAVLIALDYLVLAGVLLIVFGLFDSLDGALARIQKKASDKGMLLDASTDRMKEILLYCGSAYYLVNNQEANYAVWAVAACGASILVSYIKAKGETAIAGKKLSANEVNRAFADGIMRFEVRMAVLIIALFSGQLKYAVVFIAITSTFTAFGRLISISNKL